MAMRENGGMAWRVVRWLSATVWLMCCGEASALDLVKDGKAVSTIVVPEKAPYWTRQAAEWIRNYVGKATGTVRG